MKSFTSTSAVMVALSALSNAAPAWTDASGDSNVNGWYSSTGTPVSPAYTSSETGHKPSSQTEQSSTPVAPLTSQSFSSPVVISAPTTWTPSSESSTPVSPLSTTALSSSIVTAASTSIQSSQLSTKKHKSHYTKLVQSPSSSPVSPETTSPVSSPVGPIQQSSESSCSPTVLISSSESTSYLWSTYIYATVTTWIPVSITQTCEVESESTPVVSTTPISPISPVSTTVNNVPTTTHCVDSPSGQSCSLVGVSGATWSGTGTGGESKKSKSKTETVESSVAPAPQVTESPAQTVTQAPEATTTSESVTGFPGTLNSAALQPVVSTSLSVAAV